MTDHLETEQSLRLSRLLAQVYRTMAEQSFHVIKKHGFNPTEFAVLELLYVQGPQPLQVIASRLLLVSGGVTYVADKLEQHGFLYRNPCEKDRRVIYATLTEKGREQMEKIYPEYATQIGEVFTAMNEEEKGQLRQLLKKIG